MTITTDTSAALKKLAEQVQDWGRELGFQQVGIADIDLSRHEPKLQQWLAKGYNAGMGWMDAHGTVTESMRSHPSELLPGTLRVISARMDYLPANTEQIKILKDGTKAYVSRYALGRDYHKLIRKRLTTLAKQLETAAADLFPDIQISQRAQRR